MSLPHDLVEMVVRKEIHRIANWDSLTPERQKQFTRSAIKIGTDGLKPDTKQRLQELLIQHGLKNKSS